MEIEDRILLFGEVRPQGRPGGQRSVNADEGDLGGAVAVAQQGAQFGIGFQLLLGVRTDGAGELHVNEQVIPLDDLEHLANLLRFVERAANIQTRLSLEFHTLGLEQSAGSLDPLLDGKPVITRGPGCASS